MGTNPREMQKMQGQEVEVEVCYRLDDVVDVMKQMEGKTKIEKEKILYEWSQKPPGKGCRCGCNKKPPFS